MTAWASNLQQICKPASSNSCVGQWVVLWQLQQGLALCKNHGSSLGTFDAVLKQGKDGRRHLQSLQHHGLLQQYLSRSNAFTEVMQELVSSCKPDHREVS